MFNFGSPINHKSDQKQSEYVIICSVYLHSAEEELMLSNGHWTSEKSNVTQFISHSPKCIYLTETKIYNNNILSNQRRHRSLFKIDTQQHNANDISKIS